jgi:DNA-binding GntR family transcriptional regulator
VSRLPVAGESPFQVRRFSDLAGDLLRERILSGQLDPGAHLNEVALADELSISRPPLREAFRVLHAEGLVEMRPGKGVFVAAFDVESVRQLGDLRMALETETARLAAQRATDADLRLLAEVLAQIEIELHDSARPYPHHIDFHGALATACDNPRLAQEAAGVRQQLRLATVRSGNDPARAQAALLEHRAVCDAVMRRDVDAADSTMRAHLRSSLDAMVRMLDTVQDEEQE